MFVGIGSSLPSFPSVKVRKNRRVGLTRQAHPCFPGPNLQVFLCALLPVSVTSVTRSVCRVQHEKCGLDTRSSPTFGRLATRVCCRLAAGCPTWFLGWFRHQPGRLLQNIEDGLGAEHPVAFTVADFRHNPAGFQRPDSAHDRVVGNAQAALGIARTQEGIASDEFDELLRDFRPAPGESATPIGELSIDPLGATQGIFGLASHAIEKILDPSRPIALLGDGAQTPIVIVPGRLKKRRQIQERLGQPAARTQAFSIRRLRVSGCLVESIQLMKSRRAIGVRSLH